MTLPGSPRSAGRRLCLHFTLITAKPCPLRDAKDLQGGRMDLLRRTCIRRAHPNPTERCVSRGVRHSSVLTYSHSHTDPRHPVPRKPGRARPGRELRCVACSVRPCSFSYPGLITARLQSDRQTVFGLRAAGRWALLSSTTPLSRKPNGDREKLALGPGSPWCPLEPTRTHSLSLYPLAHAFTF